MSDSFLDDQQQSQLATNLGVIAQQFTDLMRIAHREQSPPGGRAVRNPRVPGSRPPLNIAALSTAQEIHTCMVGWVRCLAEDTVVGIPDGTDTKSLAIHLAQHVHQIGQQLWAVDMHDEVAHWAEVIRNATVAPRAPRVQDYSESQRNQAMREAVLSAQECVDLISEYTSGELALTPEVIHQWGCRGHVDRLGSTKRRRYSVWQVMAYARAPRKRARRAKQI